MKFNPLFFFIALATLFGCANKPLESSSQTFNQTMLDNCTTTDCPELQIDYITFTGETEVAFSVNTMVKDFVIESLYIEDPSQNPSANSIEAAASGFIKMYWTHHAEFPDLAAAYFAEISVSESYRNDDILSLEMKQYKYTGGAHGYGTVSYKNIDLTTGKELERHQLFKDTLAFSQFAESKFRKAYNISEDTPINNDRFWFDNDKFYVPKSLGFIQDSLVLHYNQYEIASYADGPIEIKISLQELEKYLQ